MGMRAGHRRRRRAARRSGTSPSSRRRWTAVRTAAEQGQARALLRHSGRAQEVRRWVKSRSSVCRSGAGTCPCPNQMGNGNFTFSFPNGSSLLFGADGARLPVARYLPPRAPSHHAHLLHRSARTRGPVPSFASHAHRRPHFVRYHGWLCSTPCRSRLPPSLPSPSPPPPQLSPSPPPPSPSPQSPSPSPSPPPPSPPPVPLVAVVPVVSCLQKKVLRYY